jgi:hypothetical protein
MKEPNSLSFQYQNVDHKQIDAKQTLNIDERAQTLQTLNLLLRASYLDALKEFDVANPH